MGVVSIEKANHLFWLGRYTERVFTTLKGFVSVYDNMLDTDLTAYKGYCESIGIVDIYQSKDDFVVRYINDMSDPNSIINSLYRAYDNGIVLREEISSETLRCIPSSDGVQQLFSVNCRVAPTDNLRYNKDGFGNTTAIGASKRRILTFLLRWKVWHL